MNALLVTCPAKVNTFLSVGPPDVTGYHPLRTVFQAISLCDDLLMEASETDGFQCDWPGMPLENTVTRAWRLAKEYVSLPNVMVSLTKRIPAESGLGGGSSDAAGLLRGFVRLTKGRFTLENAAEVAAAVGSDVPFFLVGGRAQGRGYGADLTPLPDVAPKHMVVTRPEQGVSTPAAYRALDEKPRPWRDFDASPDALYNDFESVAPVACRDSACALRALGATGTLLCGSGSAVFGLFPSAEAADEAEKGLERDGLSAWTCRTLTREESLWTS
ncbi:MAG: 4-(cytidine 5'-diphospho)-2-C-methyl-D-erythritol kinase [Armatimonadetes bacterium]|nr:4-(cytidine 5'-diphospho)-2-C-methyl-D-erythritol kinase [Armatimonadota bacterium]